MLIVISTWAYFNINAYRNDTFDAVIREVDRLGSTIRLGTHYAMMLNSRGDINKIIRNIGTQKGIENIRIYNKQGEIKFSNLVNEVDSKTTIKDDACFICHRTDPPMQEVNVSSRTRIFRLSEGDRLIGVISPIYNEASCSSDACHVHPSDKSVLGALDVVVSLKDTDAGMRDYEQRILFLAVLSFLATSIIVGGFLFVFVNRPINELIRRTRQIARGEYGMATTTGWTGEVAQLSTAITSMGAEIREKQEALDRQRHEYRELFEQVPCYITVQDRDLRLLRFNREFTERFAPKQGDHCYKVYKGRCEKCDPCPVLMTFEDGESHTIEETGITKEGSASHWIGRTSALHDAAGQVTAVMEMSLDITQMKRLEEEIRKSEEKYRTIFNNIPNPIFVLDRKNLSILDCNESVKQVYGYEKDEVIKTSFLRLFEESEQQNYALEIRSVDVMSQARQVTKDGRTIFTNIRLSPSEYLGKPSFLVSTSDITKKLMAEQQLIQASKMATLGEMATGIAHELNQPLSVMKTASNFLIKKVKKGEPIREDILKTMAEEIDRHVDRASKIINHLRDFGRKSEVEKVHVDVNLAMEHALDMFSQQLRVRGIDVIREFRDPLPPVLADLNRLEQVFINLLINARDAIQEQVESGATELEPRQIMIKTDQKDRQVVIEVHDTGPGIPRAIMDRIFEPFFTTKEVGKGTGLGLSISYGIVQDYDGSIRVETRNGEGATFIIQFPIAEDLP
ncbi:MAG: PAS domain S-box protein [Syntrophobacteraceae bacterium]